MGTYSTRIDMTGQRFGRLVVCLFERTDRSPNGTNHAVWSCICDCGSSVSVRRGPLVSGQTRSCGCLNNEARASRARSRAKHRSGHSPEYRTWRGMRDRCLNPKSTGYAGYGGRGIRIAAQWEDFRVFLRDVGARPSPLHTLDRIDVNGQYEPGNVRWATPGVQGVNKRNTVIVEFRGERIPLITLARRVSLSHVTVRQRLARGWSVEDAVTTPGRGGIGGLTHA